MPPAEWRDAERDAEEEMGVPDKCLHIYDVYGGETRADASDEPVLRAAMREFIETGKDSIIDFTTVWGADATIVTNAVKVWIVSTAETRARSRMSHKAAEKAGRDITE